MSGLRCSSSLNQFLMEGYSEVGVDCCLRLERPWLLSWGLSQLHIRKWAWGQQEGLLMSICISSQFQAKQGASVIWVLSFCCRGSQLSVVVVPSGSPKGDSECCALWKMSHAECVAWVVASKKPWGKSEAVLTTEEEGVGEGTFVSYNRKH